MNKYQNKNLLFFFLLENAALVQSSGKSLSQIYIAPKNLLEVLLNLCSLRGRTQGKGFLLAHRDLWVQHSNVIMTQYNDNSLRQKLRQFYQLLPILTVTQKEDIV